MLVLSQLMDIKKMLWVFSLVFFSFCRLLCFLDKVVRFYECVMMRQLISLEQITVHI